MILKGIRWNLWSVEKYLSSPWYLTSTNLCRNFYVYDLCIFTSIFLCLIIVHIFWTLSQCNNPMAKNTFRQHSYLVFEHAWVWFHGCYYKFTNNIGFQTRCQKAKDTQKCFIYFFMTSHLGVLIVIVFLWLRTYHDFFSNWCLLWCLKDSNFGSFTCNSCLILFYVL